MAYRNPDTILGINLNMVAIRAADVQRGNARGIWTISDRLVFHHGSPLEILQRWGICHETYRKVSGRWRFASVRLERLLVERVESTVPDNAETSDNTSTTTITTASRSN